MPAITIKQFDSVEEAKSCSIDSPESVAVIQCFFGLTPTESRVAVLLADGYSLQQVARLINNTEDSVRSYSKQIMAKWSVHHQHEVVRIVLNGIPITRRRLDIGPHIVERRRTLRMS